MLVWTDGSAKDATFKQYKEFKRPAKKTAFSIYYNENSALNRGKRCKYATNSLEAELEAIEYALCKAPTNYNLMIITDCQSAISLINKQSKTDKWGTLHRINKLIDKRKKTHNSTTEISHILAHSDDEKISAERKNKIKQYFDMYIEKLGKQINPFSGNIQADKLANEAANIEVDWKFDRTRTQFRNSKTLTIKCTETMIPADIKQKCQEIQQKYWMERRIKREPNNKKITEVTKITVLDKNPNYEKLYKLQGLALAGKQQCHWNLKSKKCPKWTLAKYQKIYSNTTCEFCSLNQPEDTIHIIGQCPKWEKHRRNIRIEVDKVFEKYEMEPPERFWLNSKDDYTNCRDKNDELRHYWPNKYKLYASTGRLPHKAIMKIYEQLEITNEKWLEIFEELGKVIITNITNLIKSRNKR
jgi:hypothetical protein